MIFVEWFNNNAGFTMALLTAAYVGATMWIVLESRRTNRLQKIVLEQTAALERSRKRPYVMFSIDFERVQHRRHDSTVYVYARIRNIGVTSAHNVVVKTSPELKGRLGVDAEMRRPAVLNSTITFMPPNHEVKDLVAVSQFLFEDHKDDELRFDVAIAYSDANGEHYEEKYLIDVAAQKETMTVANADADAWLQVVEQVERASRSLNDIARVIDSPDRSFLMGPGLTDRVISSEQKELLAALRVVAGATKSMLFFASQHIGDPKARIRAMRGSKEVGSEPKELSAYIEDIEYLCRVGALHGHYSRGLLTFSLTPLAEQVEGYTSASGAACDRGTRGDNGPS